MIKGAKLFGHRINVKATKFSPVRIKAVLCIISLLCPSHKVIMAPGKHCSAIDKIKDDFRVGRSPLQCLLAFYKPEGKGSANLTVCQLCHTLYPSFNTFISYRSPHPSTHVCSGLVGRQVEVSFFMAVSSAAFSIFFSF